MIIGADRPGVPSNRANAQAIFDLGLESEIVELMLHKIAALVYKLDAKQGRQETGFQSSVAAWLTRKERLRKLE